MNEIIRLVKESFSMVNDYGDTVSKMESRTVFATLRSVGQKEFYEAAAVGLKPEIVFVLEDYLDYQDEQIVLYKPFRAKKWECYRVLRTYRNDNQLELVCYRGIEDECSEVYC